ncbi:hypothetical protein CLDAP_35000 [Caldilinea aerophila DSM 14535 = NBRC 104270]|uniref:Uncharacterized protein n=1 Tax=Caldilinea aerophila (strain DSM 14535 / JCM 11387 / NBRC 104270 / STL-6-O1) TaxID=926550 RepID=I0I8F2_CALAS|nr:hypothetical protein CLDAP_35000 [Caldilinea aerophila DSM 14535 = NBRC 104270]
MLHRSEIPLKILIPPLINCCFVKFIFTIREHSIVQLRACLFPKNDVSSEAFVSKDSCLTECYSRPVPSPMRRGHEGVSAESVAFLTASFYRKVMTVRS